MMEKENITKAISCSLSSYLVNVARLGFIICLTCVSTDTFAQDWRIGINGGTVVNFHHKYDPNIDFNPNLASFCPNIGLAIGYIPKRSDIIEYALEFNWTKFGQVGSVKSLPIFFPSDVKNNPTIRFDGYQLAGGLNFRVLESPKLRLLLGVYFNYIFIEPKNLRIGKEGTFLVENTDINRKVESVDTVNYVMYPIFETNRSLGPRFNIQADYKLEKNTNISINLGAYTGLNQVAYTLFTYDIRTEKGARFIGKNVTTNSLDYMSLKLSLNYFLRNL